MKTIYKFLSLVVILTVSVSCNRDQGDTDFLNDRSNSIFFTSDEAALFVEEGASNTFEVLVGATSVVPSSLEYIITVDPSSTAVEGVDFTITNSSTSFQNGNLISTFTVQGDFDNAIIDGKTAIFNLAAADDGVIVATPNKFTLNLFKLCPFTELNTLNYNASVTAFDSEAPAFDVTVVPVPGTSNQWTLYSAWGPTFVSWATGNPAYDGAFLYSATIVLNEDFTIDVIGDDAWATGGTGSFSPCTQVFTYTLTQGLFTSSFTTDVVLTPM